MNTSSQKPKISFIIATKNRAGVIGETLQSLIKQTEPEWEALIIDDHGEDNTEEVVRSFSELRFRYFNLSSDHGTGPSCARNFGAVQARADVVAIMDSDDICYPDRAKITLAAFEKNPDAEIFYANIDVLDEATGEIRDRKTPFSEYSLERIKDGNFITHPTVAMRRQLLLDNPYNSYFRIAEDYELYSRLTKLNKRFIWSTEKVLLYRVSGNNMSIGPDRDIKTKRYGKTAKMIRGWEPFDYKVLEEIEDEK